MNTINVRTAKGFVALPVKRLVTLCGMSGFALHRPLKSDMTGPDDHGWVVSHIETGFKLMNSIYCSTMKEALNVAENNLHKYHVDTPETFAIAVAKEKARLEAA